MAKNEKTSKRVASLAGKALRKPGSITVKQQRSVNASAVTQAPDKPKGKRKK
jgi:hypothetical protein